MDIHIIVKAFTISIVIENTEGDKIRLIGNFAKSSGCVQNRIVG
jgi:hypothetical protein